MKNAENKLYGLALIACGILSAMPEGDLTAALLLVPLGLGCLLTRDNVAAKKRR